MSVTTRRKRAAATEAERAARFNADMADWRARHKHHFYGPPDRSTRCWALLDARGRVMAVALAPSESALDWTRDGIKPGWSIRECSGMRYDALRAHGAPLTQGVEERPLAAIRARAAEDEARFAGARNAQGDRSRKPRRA